MKTNSELLGPSWLNIYIFNKHKYFNIFILIRRTGQAITFIEYVKICSVLVLHCRLPRDCFYLVILFDWKKRTKIGENWGLFGFRLKSFGRKMRKYRKFVSFI